MERNDRIGLVGVIVAGLALGVCFPVVMEALRGVGRGNYRSTCGADLNGIGKQIII